MRTLAVTPFSLATAEAAPWPTRRRDIALLSVGAIALHGVVYFLANHYPRVPAQQLAMTAFDLAVPYWPWTVFVYLSDYLLLIVAFQGCRTRLSADRFLATELSVIGFSTLVHWAMPVAFPRERYPVPEGLAMLPALAMNLLRSFDAAASCMPSLHVATSVLVALLLRREQPRAFPWLLGWAGLVAASTLTTKQHYLVDVAAGIAVAVVAWLVAEHLRPLPPATAQPTVRRVANGARR